jgi:hypothetical protein
MAPFRLLPDGNLHSSNYHRVFDTLLFAIIAVSAIGANITIAL